MFVRTGTTWAQQAELTAADGRAGDKFGIDVDISGETAVIGAFQDDIGASTDQGSAYVFVRSGATWTQQAQLTASDGAPFDGLGIGVAIAGDTAVVGAFQVDIGSHISQGAAYVFVRNGTTWTRQSKLFDSAGAGGDNFGFSVAISGSQVVAGAPSAATASTSGQSLGRPASVGTGAAYVFALTATSPPVSISGRVVTPDGTGLRNARVFITDPNGIARAVLTNSFGNYQFLSVQSGMTYTIGVASKRFRFSSRVLLVADNLTNVDFVGIE